MEINWFPGHMAKTLREMKDHLRQVDLVIETCDARIPESSRNPELSRLIGGKPRILLLNKADLADPEATRAWMAWYLQKGITVFASDSTRRTDAERIREAALDLMKDKIERAKSKGRLFQPVRAMVAGIPNTGKSTLINTLAKKRIAQAQDRPGVTRNASWIRSAGQLELLDTPGVLWPKIDNRDSQLVLAATGAIRDVVLDLEDVACRTMDLLFHHYPQLLAERYGVGQTDLENGDDSMLALDESAVRGYRLLRAAAMRRGCLLPGGRVDTARFAILFLDELRGGKIGRITLEWPPVASKASERKSPEP